MKIMIATTPIRPKPTYFPPIGSLSIINYMRKHGIGDVEFYNIDANRPPHEDVLAHIRDAKPDVLGISAVVSTAYAYTRKLADDVKAMAPDTLIVAGGNLAASAEVLLRRTGADLCILGEGEKVFYNIVKRAETTRRAADFADIPGLMLLGGDGGLINTGYETALGKDEVYDIDWDDLEASTDIDIFIHKLFDEDGRITHPTFAADARVHEPHRRNKRFAILADGKGCVSRCTFCHRWDKGMRYIPIEIYLKRLDELIERYDVGFLEPALENFGTDKRWLKAFCEEIKKRDILWATGAVRTKSVTPEIIEMMRDSGCVTISYGMETGSARMLEVMEKKTSIDDNYNAQKWTAEAGFETVVQLVLGMPGESPETIRETIEFCKYSFTLNPNLDPNNLSINYAQALPGTPLYEYARHKGLVGGGVDGEEAYLLQISDRDAHDEIGTLNFTDYPSLVCQAWRPLITVETNYAYVEKFGLERYHHTTRKKGPAENAAPSGDDGYHANPKRLSKTAKESFAMPALTRLILKGRFGEAMIAYPVFFYRLRRFLVLMVLFKNLTRFPLSYNLKLVGEYLAYKLKPNGMRKSSAINHKSLRKVVQNDMGALAGDTPEMMPLRRGR